MNQIKLKLAETQNLIMKIKESASTEVQGHLRCHMYRGKHPQYYLVNEETCRHHPRGRYLKKSELEIARTLAQRDYDDRLLKVLEQNERLLRNLLEKYDENALKEVYESLTEARKRLVLPRIPSDQDYLAQWIEQHPQDQNPYSKQISFQTERGEIVRSKSEKMIADKFFYRNIPYAYEAPLQLAGGRVIYPDFTLLNVRKRKTYYLEHIGMMDNPEYCKNALDKIERYEQNQILLGKKLLLSMECTQKSINMKKIDVMIERFLL